MVRSNFLLAGLLCLPILGCASVPQPVQTRLPDVAVPHAEPVTMQGYTWKVYKSKDIAVLADDLAKHPNKDFVVFALTPNGYKKMTNNYYELERYIAEQRAIIVYLKQTISARAPAPETK